MSEQQRTEAWLARRAGKITASRAKDVLALSKRDGKPLQARHDYCAELVVERLTGKSMGIPMTEPMKWGVDCEPLARTAYEAYTGQLVAECGFCAHPLLDYVGASPDGLVGLAGLVEIKCPYNQRVHLETLLTGMPEDHMAQIQCQMWVLDRQSCDFVSFDPRMPEGMQLHIEQIARDEKFIKGLAGHCEELHAEVAGKVAQLRSRFLMKAAA